MCLSVPGQILELKESHGLRMGKVDFGGVSRDVCLEHVDVVPGDWVLVHVGFALTKISGEEAIELRRMLAEITGLEEEPVEP